MSRACNRPRTRGPSPWFDVHDPRGFPDPANTKFHGKPLVYLDNAATTQKPQSVIDAITRYYAQPERQHPPRRLSAEPDRDRLLRRSARQGAAVHQRPHNREIIFTRGTTEGINLVAASLGARAFANGDEILITAMEHHSNIVPWQ